MALQVNENYVDNFGNEYTNLYCKIINVALNTASSECFIHLGYFRNKDCSDNNLMSIKQYTNSFIPNDLNGNLREQSYVYLKTLPEFSGAIDVLE